MPAHKKQPAQAKTPAMVNRAVKSPPAEEPAILREDSPEYGVALRNQREQFTCIDLFAGCGGLALGLEQAGFRPLLFSELNKSAAETYIANRVGKAIIPWGDIYQLSDENLELLKLNWLYEGIGDIDLVCGGPPCQGFSGIGHRRSFKLEKKDIPSNHLYQEMARFFLLHEWR